jgi:TrmH family RNA methyltransferase
MITSPQNPRLKLARALQGRSKERRSTGAFLAEGVRLVEEAQRAGWPIRFALYSDDLSPRGQVLVEDLRASDVSVDQVDAHLLQAVSDTETSQGIIAVLDLTPLPVPPNPDFIIIPDQIRDPGNLGTLLRTAAAAGAQAVLVPPETVDPFSPKVVRAGMGAHFRLPVQTLDWESIHQFCQKNRLQTYLADMAGTPCWESDLRVPLGLVIGGEAEGASEQARGLVDRAVSIPMPGRIESLNAGVAGAILMFEVVRQRR